MRKNRFLMSMLAAVLLAAMSWAVAHADIPTPAQITAYFTAGGQPFLVENYADFPFECADFMQDPVACDLRVDLPVSATPPAPAAQSYERRFLIALLLTWLIEIPILFVLARYAFKVRQVSVWRILGSGLLASALTLPYLWFLLPSILTTASGIYLGEVLVFLVEALLYHWLLGLSYPKAVLLSFAVNAVSFLLGLFLL